MASEMLTTVTGTEQQQPSIDELPTPEVVPWIKEIWGFNSSDHAPWLLFRADTPQPVDVSRPLVIVIDLSGSMEGNMAEARAALGELIRGSNAEGKVVMPKPSGQTGYVKACSYLQPHVQGCDVVFLGDGAENCQKEPLHVMSPDGTVSTTLDFSAVSGNAYLGLVATFIMHICRHKIFLVGIGADARTMADSLVTRANCHVALVNRRASTREIAGVVRAVRNAPARREAQLALGHTPQEPGIIVNLSPEAQEMINRLTDAEVQAVAAAGNSIVVRAETSLPPPPMSPAEVKTKFEAAEVGIPARFTEYSVPKVRAAALLSITGMIDGKIPAAYFTGQYSGLLTVEPDLKKKLNVLFSALKNQGLLKSMGTTPAKGDGPPLIIDGKKMPEKAIIYKCLAPIEAIKACMEDPTFAAPQSSLKKRVRSDEEGSASGSGSGDESVSVP